MKMHKQKLADINKAKIELKKRLARLSFKEKILRVIEMQKMSATFRKNTFVWNP